MFRDVSNTAGQVVVFFGLLFWFRGFAVAAYTHALYDIYVLVLKP